jgi:hypothetical protein
MYKGFKATWDCGEGCVNGASGAPPPGNPFMHLPLDSSQPWIYGMGYWPSTNGTMPVDKCCRFICYGSCAS